VICPTCHEEIPDDNPECPNCADGGAGEPTIMYIPVSEHPAWSEEEASHLEGVMGVALVVERGPTAGKTYVLNRGTTTVGRHPDSDIFLNDVTVSRHHCRFQFDGASLIVEDSGSTNGTYVRDVLVERAPLKPGDEVIIGKYHLLVALGDG